MYVKLWIKHVFLFYIFIKNNTLLMSLILLVFMGSEMFLYEKNIIAIYDESELWTVQLFAVVN